MTGIVPTPAACLRAELTYLRGQIAAHRSGPALRPRAMAAIVGSALALVAAFSISIPSCETSGQDMPFRAAR